MVQAYYTDGGVVAGVQLPLVKPYQVSFDSLGDVWVADKGGIWEPNFLLFDNNVLASMSDALTPPIYGVAAN